jgi:hypothetical protein
MVCTLAIMPRWERKKIMFILGVLIKLKASLVEWEMFACSIAVKGT